MHANSNAGLNDRLVSVAAYIDPIEANLASKFLNRNGVQARVVGDFTSNFQVEIASEIQVLVSLPQLDLARNLLANFKSSQNAVDWSKVDVGDETPPEEDESADRSWDTGDAIRCGARPGTDDCCVSGHPDSRFWWNRKMYDLRGQEHEPQGGQPIYRCRDAALFRILNTPAT